MILLSRTNTRPFHNLHSAGSLSLKRVILFAQRPYASACLITHNGTSNSNRRLFLKFKNLLYVNLDQVSHLMCGLLGPKIVLHRSFVWLTRILIITTIMTISIKDMKIIILKAKNNKTRTKTSKTTGLARANSCLERSVNKWTVPNSYSNYEFISKFKCVLVWFYASGSHFWQRRMLQFTSDLRRRCKSHPKQLGRSLSTQLNYFSNQIFHRINFNINFYYNQQWAYSFKLLHNKQTS